MKRNRTIAAVVFALTVGGFIAGRATADQPHMQSALSALESAEAHLRQASDDKGGHKNKALRHVDNAIAEVKKGMKFDRRH